MIRVIICDDQAVVCEGLKAILGTEPDIEVVGIAYNGQEALDQIETTHPDLVLMDLKMPEMNGIQATQLSREKHPEIPVLVLTTYDADEWVFDAVRAGASGYLLKDTPRAELIHAVKNTVKGETFVDSKVAGKLLRQVSQTRPYTADSSAIDQLSGREVDVLKLIARGFSNTEIAARLYLSEGTIRNYVSSILSKLNVSDRTQAAVLALRQGFGANNGK
jgi:NarL family two-component system response regulator LiaR